LPVGGDARHPLPERTGDEFHRGVSLRVEEKDGRGSGCSGALDDQPLAVRRQPRQGIFVVVSFSQRLPRGTVGTLHEYVEVPLLHRDECDLLAVGVPDGFKVHTGRREPLLTAAKVRNHHLHGASMRPCECDAPAVRRQVRFFMDRGSHTRRLQPAIATHPAQLDVVIQTTSYVRDDSIRREAHARRQSPRGRHSEGVAEDHLRVARGGERFEVEWNEFVCAGIVIEHVPRAVTRGRARKENTVLSCLQVEEANPRLRKAGGRIPDREQHVSSVGQGVRPPVAPLAARAIERTGCRDLSAVRRHRDQAGVIPPAREVDPVVGPPPRAWRIRAGPADIERITAGHSDPLDPAVGEEPHPPSVRRDERRLGALRTGQRDRYELRQSPDVDPV
jgi:hypothetical protein